MKAQSKIQCCTGSAMWGLVLWLVSLTSCVQFEPVGFLFVSTDTVDVELGEQGIYEFQGSIENIGEEPITQHGFCWSANVNAHISDDTTSLGETEKKGIFTSEVDGLEALVTYYVRAYVMTEEEVLYGDEKSFTTSALSVPTIRTDEVIHFDQHSAECGGEVQEEGRSALTERGVCWSTSTKPTLSDQSASDEGELGSFTIGVTGLELDTYYYVRAYAVNSEGIAYGEEVSFKTWATNEISDYDGNIYPIIDIGEQTWMRRNLKVTHYADGTPIPEVKDYGANITDGDRAYCWYNNDEQYASGYGALYTWAAVMNGAESSDANPSEIQGVCPDGWHVPSDQEWQQMEIYLGVDSAMADTIVFRNRGEDYGGKLKETGFTHWRNPNTGATNISGFTAVGGGYQYANGNFRGMERIGIYWTSTTYQDTDRALTRSLDYNNTYIDRDYNRAQDAVSVRCVKDGE